MTTFKKIKNEQIVDENFNTKKKKKIILFGLAGFLILGVCAFFAYKSFYKADEFPCLESNTEIYEKYKNAVVMIKTEYAYFAIIKGKEIQLDLPDIETETITGTGFFVDEKGVIATNLHVIKPWLYTDDSLGGDIQKNVSNIRMKIASILTIDVPEDEYAGFLSSNWGSANVNGGEEYEGEGGDEESGDEEVQPAVVENRGEEFTNPDETTNNESVDIAASIPEKEYVSIDDIVVYTKATTISVGLHDSNTDEWLESRILKLPETVSENDAENSETNITFDIALIQLISEKTPTSDYIDKNSFATIDTDFKPGSKAVMIGFPLGMDLATDGNNVIKGQMYNGEISKESDGFNIQYSITSTHGASGAPVFNECGNLIAINYGGIDQLQGYNFGIIAKQLYDFCQY